MKKIILPSLLLLLLSSCGAYYNSPYSSDNAQIGTVTGAALGAGLGALVSSKSDRGKGALIGAGAGAVLGGTGGALMDRR